jgi:cytochrome P450
MMNKKIFYDHHRYIAEEVCKFDFRLEMQGPKPIIKLLSYDAQQGLEALTTDKIDRSREYIGIGKIIGDSFGMSRSNFKAMHRRKLVLNMLSFNACSKYIPIMFDCLKHEIGEWKVGQTFNSVYEMNVLTFGFFTVVFFGEDMLHISHRTIDFENKQNQWEKKNLRDSLIQIVKDFFEGLLHPIASFAPVAAKGEWCNPYKRNRRNLNRFKAALKQAIADSTDKQSICNLLMEDPKIDNNEVFEDILGFLCAGTETTSHTMVVILYQLKKNPDKLAKCMEELEKYGFTDLSSKKAYTPENIENLVYITNVIKESLRLDGPTVESLHYQAYEDVEIAGVPFKKGTKFIKDLSVPHYNPDEFKDPLKFIPERFDPESEYFLKPNGKPRRPYSFIPFSFGCRACPGQSFAMMELKVALTYILTHVDYNIDQAYLDNEAIGFAVGSNFDCPMTVNKVSY